MIEGEHHHIAAVDLVEELRSHPAEVVNSLIGPAVGLEVVPVQKSRQLMLEFFLRVNASTNVSERLRGVVDRLVV